jgi:hypothetical protein
LLATLPHNDTVHGAVWNADESRILSWSFDGSAKLWDADGNAIDTLSHDHDDRVWGATWNRTESRILSWGGDSRSNTGSARLWDADGNLLATLPHDDDVVHGATWSADESRILTWSHDGSVKLWDTDSAALVTFNPDSAVEGVTWNADATRLRSWDWGSAKLWGAGGNLLTALPHDGAIQDVTWNSHDSRIFARGDSTVSIHFMQRGDLLELACRAARRNFTFSEWQQYMGDAPYRRTCAPHPLHPSYRADVVARLASGALDEAAAINEVARALQVDPYATGDPPAELLAEARAIVAGLGR